jgi:hypothetical protein
MSSESRQKSKSSRIHTYKNYINFALKFYSSKSTLLCPCVVTFFNDKILLNRLAFIIIFVIDDKCFHADWECLYENEDWIYSNLVEMDLIVDNRLETFLLLMRALVRVVIKARLMDGWMWCFAVLHNAVWILWRLI